MEALRLCLACLKIGAFVFGGGMVMIPLLETDVVQENHWLSEQEFVDAVALGQMTPGPLLVTATFVGFKIGLPHGVPAALLIATAATICVFLPSFVMTISASNRLNKLQSSPWVKSFMWGVRASVVGLIVGAALMIARTTMGTAGNVHGLVQMGILCSGALAILIYSKVDAGLVVIGCGGLALASFGIGALVGA